MDRSARTAAAVRGVLAELARRLDLGLSVELWDGSRVPLGTDVPDDLRIVIAAPGVLASLLRRPTLETLVRLYAAGGIDVAGGDTMTFAGRLREKRVGRRLKGMPWLAVARALWPLLWQKGAAGSVDAGLAVDDHGPGSRHAADALIRFDYDVGNDFYRLFLDPEMQYSCAYFTDWDNGLEQAQRDKLEMICRKLRLRPGLRLLDVGCGWGGLLRHAARHHGVEAHGVTLSRAQFEHASRRAAEEGLADRIRVELKDYRELTGSYDRIASIGMYEHVGIAGYPVYFGKLRDLLAPRGLLLNHGITRRAKPSRGAFRRLRPEARLIRRYIFPGSELDHIGHTVEAMEQAGFEVHDVEDWREHYARTTALWCRRLDARRAEAERLAGAPRTRLWLAYLAGVSVNFDAGSLLIYQTLASRRGRGASGLPPTRADLYRD